MPVPSARPRATATLLELEQILLGLESHRLRQRRGHGLPQPGGKGRAARHEEPSSRACRKTHYFYLSHIISKVINSRSGLLRLRLRYYWQNPETCGRYRRRTESEIAFINGNNKRRLAPVEEH